MSPTERRLLVIHVLELVAALEEEPQGMKVGARRAAALLHMRQPRQAVAALRESGSEFIAELADVVAGYLRSELRVTSTA